MHNLTVQQRRQLRGLITMFVLTLFGAYVFYFNSDKTEPITFGFIVGDEWKLIKEWVIVSKTGAGIFLSLSIVGVLVGYLQLRSKRTLSLSSFIFGFSFIMAFLC